MLREEPDPVRRETLKFHLLQEYLPPYYLCEAFCSSVTCKFVSTTPYNSKLIIFLSPRQLPLQRAGSSVGPGCSHCLLHDATLRSWSEAQREDQLQTTIRIGVSRGVRGASGGFRHHTNPGRRRLSGEHVPGPRPRTPRKRGRGPSAPSRP